METNYVCDMYSILSFIKIGLFHLNIHYILYKICMRTVCLYIINKQMHIFVRADKQEYLCVRVLDSVQSSREDISSLPVPDAKFQEARLFRAVNLTPEMVAKK